MQVTSQIPNEVVDCTQNGKCSDCGNCCTNFLPMSQYEIDKIKKYVAKHQIREHRHNAMIGFDMTCPFRDEKSKKCLVYDVRPEICSSFMCNHLEEDIEKAKIDFHQSGRIVFMRKEFFNSKEDAEYIKMMTSAFRSVMKND